MDFLLQLQRENGVTPAALLNRPTLPQELVQTYNAFIILNRARGKNMAGEQPIRLSEIYAYLGIVGETCPERRGATMRLICEMDGAYLEHQAKKAAK